MDTLYSTLRTLDGLIHEIGYDEAQIQEKLSMLTGICEKMVMVEKLHQEKLQDRIKQETRQLALFREALEWPIETEVASWPLMTRYQKVKEARLNAHEAYMRMKEEVLSLASVLKGVELGRLDVALSECEAKLAASLSHGTDLPIHASVLRTLTSLHAKAAAFTAKHDYSLVHEGQRLASLWQALDYHPDGTEPDELALYLIFESFEMDKLGQEHLQQVKDLWPAWIGRQVISALVHRYEALVEERRRKVADLRKEMADLVALMEGKEVGEGKGEGEGESEGEGEGAVAEPAASATPDATSTPRPDATSTSPPALASLAPVAPAPVAVDPASMYRLTEQLETLRSKKTALYQRAVFAELDELTALWTTARRDPATLTSLLASLSTLPVTSARRAFLAQLRCLRARAPSLQAIYQLLDERSDLLTRMTHFEATVISNPNRLFNSSFQLVQEDKFRKSALPDLLKLEDKILDLVQRYQDEFEGEVVPVPGGEGGAGGDGSLSMALAQDIETRCLSEAVFGLSISSRGDKSTGPSTPTRAPTLGRVLSASPLGSPAAAGGASGAGVATPGSSPSRAMAHLSIKDRTGLTSPTRRAAALPRSTTS